MARSQAVLEAQVAQLKAQIDELIHINSEWDKEYKEQDEAFRRYRYDSQQAQSENHSIIQRLKEKNATLEEKVSALHDQLQKARKELYTLQKRISSMGSVQGSRGRDQSQMEEENTLLRQQLKAYQEDFEAERRDRERISDEKQSAVLKYEAEITSLRLQLDRCRNDLAHYTAEATRLAQQLKLKNQYEEEQYRQHLESKGFVSRSPNGLPPLDPFVEIDQQYPASPPPSLPPRHRDWVVVPNGMVNGLDKGMVMQNGSVLANGHEPSLPSTARQYVNGSVSPVRGRREDPAPTRTNYHLVHRGPQDNEIASAPAYLTPTPLTNGVVERDAATPPPPLPSRGQYSCPRCARRFQKKDLFQQHKERCLS